MDELFQLTKEQAITLASSGAWRNWSDEEVVKFQLYQRLLCMDFGRFHEALEKVLGRPVWTHELGLDYKGIVAEYEGKRGKPTMEQIVGLIPKEKLIVVKAGGENGGV